MSSECLCYGCSTLVHVKLFWGYKRDKSFNVVLDESWKSSSVVINRQRCSTIWTCVLPPATSGSAETDWRDVI